MTRMSECLNKKSLDTEGGDDTRLAGRGHADSSGMRRCLIVRARRAAFNTTARPENKRGKARIKGQK